MTFDHLYRQTAAACQSQSQSENDINTDTTSDIQNHHSISNSNSNSKSMHNSRTQVLLLGAAIGNLCTQIVCLAPLDRAPITASTHDTDTDTNTDTDTDNDHPDPFWNQPSPSRQTIYTSIAKIFQSILLLAHTTHLNNNGNDNGNGIDNDNINNNNNLQSSILKKMDLNARKYPVHLCKGKSGKYTEYSKETGITVENQSLRDIDLSNCVTVNDNDTSASASINNDTSLNLSLNLENLDLNLSCLENDDDDGHDGDIDISKDQLQLLPKSVSELSVMIREFAMDRNWSTYHTPRNIVLAMMGEMGELAEIFQWEGDCDSQLQLNGLNGVNSWPEDKKDHLEQELADVSIYCLRLADVVGIRDLGLLVHDLFVGDAAGDGNGDGK